MARRLVVVLLTLLLLTVGPTAPVHADLSKLPPDNTTLPIIDEQVAGSPLAQSVRINVPAGGAFEVAGVVEGAPGANDPITATAGWRNVDTGDYETVSTTGGWGQAGAEAVVLGTPALHREVRAQPSPDEAGLVGTWVVNSQAAGTYVVDMWTASSGTVAWSRLRIRASEGTTVVDDTLGTTTFSTVCGDFDGGTQVSAGTPAVGATAALGRAKTVSVAHGLVGLLVIQEREDVTGSILGVRDDLGATSYTSPDGAVHPGAVQRIESPLTGPFTFTVDHAVAAASDCGFVTGADLAPA